MYTFSKRYKNVLTPFIFNAAQPQPFGQFLMNIFTESCRLVSCCVNLSPNGFHIEEFSTQNKKNNDLLLSRVALVF